MEPLSIMLGVIGLLVITPLAVVGARVIWRRPAWGIVLVVALVGLPLRTGPETGTGVHLTPADLGATVLVLVVALRALLVDDRRSLTRTTVLAPIAMGIAILVAGALSTGGGAIPGMVRYLQLFCLVPLAAALAIRDARDRTIVIGAFLTLAGLEGAFGVFQYLTHTGAGFGGQSVRAVGTFGAYDVMALSKVVAFGIVAAVAVACRGRHRRAAVVGAVLLLLPLALALSRGTWLAVAGAVAVVLLVHDARRLIQVAAIAVVAGALVLAVSGPDSTVRRRFDSLVGTANAPDSSVRNRYELWNAAIGMWEEHPVTGVGPKRFAELRTRYASIALDPRSDVADASGFRRVELLSPHNLYLLVLSELGVLGLGAFLALLASALGAAIGAARDRIDRSGRSEFGLFALGAVTVIAITGMSGDLGGPTTVLEAAIIGCALGCAAVPGVPRPAVATPDEPVRVAG